MGVHRILSGLALILGCGSTDGTAMQDGASLTDSGDETGCATLSIGPEQYLYCKQLMTYDDAQALCMDRSRDLVIFESRAEQDSVFAAIESGEPFEAWIGIDDTEDCNWRWVNGATPSYLGFQDGVSPSPPCECVVLTDPNRWEPRACRFSDQAYVLCE